MKLNVLATAVLVVGALACERREPPPSETTTTGAPVPRPGAGEGTEADPGAARRPAAPAPGQPAPGAPTAQPQRQQPPPPRPQQQQQEQGGNGVTMDIGTPGTPDGAPPAVPQRFVDAGRLSIVGSAAERDRNLGMQPLQPPDAGRAVPATPGGVEPEPMGRVGGDTRGPTEVGIPERIPGGAAGGTVGGGTIEGGRIRGATEPPDPRGGTGGAMERDGGS